MATAWLWKSAFLTTVIALGACSSNQSAPTYMLGQAEEVIREAKNSGAASSAPLALKNSEDNLRKAKNAIEDEDFKVATQYLESSIVDSEYAIAKAEADKAEKAAEQISEGLKTLRNETNY